MNKNEIVIFETEDKLITLPVAVDHETVWLNRNQMAELFDRDVKTIGKHINNALREELESDKATVAKFATVQKEGTRQVTRQIEYYNLDMIISIGYRVKSKNGILFRKWAHNILREYLLKGYVINDRHFQDIEYVTKMLDQYKEAGGKLPSSDAMLEFLKAYQKGFKILDDYDHHTLEVPEGQKDVYVIQYDECIKLIHNTMFANQGD